MRQEFTIHGRLPALNDYTRANRANRYAGNKMKREAMDQVAWAIRQASLKQITSKVKVSFKWVEQTRRRDLDNVCFAKKFILDALQETRTLQGDGWKHVMGFTDVFSVDKENPRIVVELIEVGEIDG